MKTALNAAILSVGTELTIGQILNRNAAWISAELKKCGLETVLHLTVPDSDLQIEKGLDYCSNFAQVIFVTGGLGPTSDDFTRDVVAKWCKKTPLWFSDEAWEHVQKRLLERGYHVHDFQKQQCYFPKDAKPIPNTQGTAFGFSLKKDDLQIFVLPGPPREVAEVWKQGVNPWLEIQTKNLDPLITKSWDVLGRGESEVAALVEPLFIQGSSNVERGYRVHLPYVEFKVTFRKSQASIFSKLIEKIEELLSPHTLCRDGEDLAEKVMGRIQKLNNFAFLDSATSSHLLRRLEPHLRYDLRQKPFHFQSYSPQSEIPQPPTSFTTSFTLHALDELRTKFIFKSEKGLQEHIVETPLKSSFLKERRPMYTAEVGLAFLSQCL